MYNLVYIVCIILFLRTANRYAYEYSDRITAADHAQFAIAVISHIMLHKVHYDILYTTLSVSTITGSEVARGEVVYHLIEAGEAAISQ